MVPACVSAQARLVASLSIARLADPNAVVIVFDMHCIRGWSMWLLTFSLLGLLIGYDLRNRAQDMRHDDSRGAIAIASANANAAGAWISLIGAVCLNLAVWSVFSQI
jgi:hypothetical protein